MTHGMSNRELYLWHKKMRALATALADAMLGGPLAEDTYELGQVAQAVVYAAVEIIHAIDDSLPPDGDQDEFLQSVADLFIDLVDGSPEDPGDHPHLRVVK